MLGVMETTDEAEDDATMTGAAEEWVGCITTVWPEPNAIPVGGAAFAFDLNAAREEEAEEEEEEDADAAALLVGTREPLEDRGRPPPAACISDLWQQRHEAGEAEERKGRLSPAARQRKRANDLYQSHLAVC
jgi:hypothetical protein